MRERGMSRRSGDCGIILRMGILDVKSAVAEIEASTDMLERVLKLSGLITTMFQHRVFSDFGVLAELRALKEEVSRG